MNSFVLLAYSFAIFIYSIFRVCQQDRRRSKGFKQGGWRHSWDRNFKRISLNWNLTVIRNGSLETREDLSLITFKRVSFSKSFHFSRLKYLHWTWHEGAKKKHYGVIVLIYSATFWRKGFNRFRTTLNTCFQTMESFIVLLEQSSTWFNYILSVLHLHTLLRKRASFILKLSNSCTNTQVYQVWKRVAKAMTFAEYFKVALHVEIKPQK